MNKRNIIMSIVLLITLAAAGFFYYNQQNKPEVLYQNGLKYHLGRGVEKDPDKAIKYYEKAAKQDHYRAQNNLSILYIESKKPKNLIQAHYWLDQMIQKNEKDTQALFHLGNLLSEDFYVGYNPEDSFYFYHAAAELGDASAQYNVAVNLDEGFGTEKNIQEAVKYYQKASEQGHPSASYNLGLAYAKGKKIKQDIEKAEFYLNRACQHGEKKGCEVLNIIQNAKSD